MTTHSRYLELEPSQLEKAVADDLKAALEKRGVRVEHDGKPGRPDIILESDGFAVVVEVAKRRGASAASEFPAVRDHREQVKAELGKPTFLLFSCIKTPQRFIRSAQDYNRTMEKEPQPGRVLFLNLDDLARVLFTLESSSADLYGFERWRTWFETWLDVGNDVASLERFQQIVVHEDATLRAEVAERVEQFKQAAQEQLRKDIRKLEDKLRYRGVVKETAHRALVYTMFVKLYEEKRVARGKGYYNRFTTQGFARYKASLPASAKREYENRTLHHLIDKEIAYDGEIEEAGILEDYALPDKIKDEFVEREVLSVLDKYTFQGSLIDALGAVFEALARRAEKDTRIGQFFTPEPIVRFAVDISEPKPTETVLDPAVGTGRFLVIAMEKMEAQAGEVRGQARDRVLEQIHRQLILGTDADIWISRIARMNMYIHGDGKSNIRRENGLFLADLSVFTGLEGNLAQAVDLCMTNPPLGDMDYQTYAKDLAEREGNDPALWIRERLPILPGHYKEEQQIRDAEVRIAEWAAREREAIRGGDEAEEAKAVRWRAYHEEKKAAARQVIAENAATYVVTGNTAKGSALFLAAIKNYLKPVSEAGAVEEWRGGRLAIVVDEAILNAPEYAATRRFIARHYFIKGVFSFDRDAFWYQARTTAKTSLLYLYAKPDSAVVQREPIFMCHINKIGFTRTGKPERSDLPNCLEAYKKYEGAIAASYRGNAFDEGQARATISALELPYTIRLRWAGEVEADDRLDYAFEAARQIRAGLSPGHPKLGDLAEIVVREPEEEEMGIYTFATIERRTGRVKVRGVEGTAYRPQELRVIRTGDIVISGIDLVHGSVGYARGDVDEAVVSHEFYVLRVRDDLEGVVDARFLALLLRTTRMRELVAGTVTGTSNRTRVESAEALLNLPLPELPAYTSQQAIAAEVDEAMSLEERAVDSLRSALKQANKLWGRKMERMTPVRGDLRSLFYTPDAASEPDAADTAADRRRGGLPFPDKDISPALQRTLKRKFEQEAETGEIESVDRDTFFGMLGEVSKPPDEEDDPSS